MYLIYQKNTIFLQSNFLLCNSKNIHHIQPQNITEKSFDLLIELFEINEYKDIIQNLHQ